MNEIKISSCPFCSKNKTKLESKSSNAQYKNTDAGRIKGNTHSFSVRCNCCHARGPVSSVWVPSLHRYQKAPDASYEQDIEKCKQSAILKWNSATK